MSKNPLRIDNPFDPDNIGPVALRRNGLQVIVPAGTIIRTMHPSQGPYRVAKKATKVTVHLVNWGYIGRDRHDEGRVHLPSISWAGAGGYWCDAQVTPEFAAANGVELPKLPVPDENGRLGGRHLVEVIPSYEDGYTDRWTL